MNEEFREYCKSKHIKFKRGVVLEGIPGTGKSLSIKHIRKLAEENDISFHVFDGVKEFMEEANRLYSREEKKIFVFEDFDAFLRDRNDTNDAPNQILGKVLNTLDGVDKVDNVVSIFTTNKIDLFDTAFIRPGRIDKVFTYVLPDISDVKKFIYAYLSEDNANIVYPIVKEHKEHAMINLTYAILKGLCDEINIFLFEKITESDKEIIIEKADAQRIIDEKIRAANKNEKTGSKSDYTL
ncbi:MAG: ATP-binding protein [Nanoarchaeota archaeon]